MTRAVYVILICGLMILAEMTAASFGLLLPFFSYAVFYFSGVLPFSYAFCAAVAGGAILNFTSGFPLPVSSVSSILTAWAGYFWTRKVSSGSMFLHVMPGMLIPFIHYPLLIAVHAGTGAVLNFIPGMLLSSVFSGITLPLWCSLFHIPVKLSRLNFESSEQFGKGDGE